MVRNDQGDFHCSRRYERTRSQYELGSRVPVISIYISFRPRTILRSRSRTPVMSIAKPSCLMPNSLLRRKYDATFALIASGCWAAPA